MAVNVESIGAAQAQRLKRAYGQPLPQQPRSFQEILRSEQGRKSDEIKFSAHAQMRLDERNIVLSTEDRMRLAQAIQSVRDKGGRDSLVLMNENAFIVNAPNQTVVTAMDQASLREHIFTNIDSAVII